MRNFRTILRPLRALRRWSTMTSHQIQDGRRLRKCAITRLRFVRS